MLIKDYILKFLYLLELWVKSSYFFLSLFTIISLWKFIDIAIDVVTRDEITYYDKVIVGYLNNIASLYSTGLAIFITKFGAEYIVLFLLPVVLVFLLLKHIKEGFFLLITTGGAFILNNIVKILFDRARPVVGTPVIQETGYSFPSGHAMIATCFYGALIYLSYRYIKNKRLRIFSYIFFSVFILLIGLSRVYLGVHYPSDVLAGFSLGAFWLGLCILLYRVFPLTFSGFKHQ
ncbi:MAG: phosphoesterase PA-phosphatase related protein [uncultured bacterium]|nr:MAG: phosphoesterase PA-phosphatase related protein [uncultured bacterium]